MRGARGCLPRLRFDGGCGEWIWIGGVGDAGGSETRPYWGDWRWFAPTPVAFGLWPREIEECDIGEVLHAFEDNFTAVRGDVEVANVKVLSEVGQLPLGAGL